MLLVCTGPDTWSAHEKARDLARAFREKYDSNGEATSTMFDATASDVLNQFGAPSLFAKKSFIRADGWLSKIKPEDFQKLRDRIVKDQDMTILVTVIDELPPKIEPLCKAEKIVVYAHPLKTGSVFVTWCAEQAKKMGYAGSVKDIAELYDGDSWAAMSEIQKRVAYANAPLAKRDDVDASNFDVSDAVLAERAGWRQSFTTSDDVDGVVVALLSSLRSYYRVISGKTDGIHPFVQRKLKTMRIMSPARMMLFSLRSFVLTRTSRGTIEETTLHE